MTATAKGKRAQFEIEDGKLIANPNPDLLPRITEPGTCFLCRQNKPTKPHLIPFVKFGKDQRQTYRRAEVCSACRKRPPRTSRTQAELAKAAAAFRATDKAAQAFTKRKQAERDAAEKRPHAKRKATSAKRNSIKRKGK